MNESLQNVSSGVLKKKIYVCNILVAFFSFLIALLVLRSLYRFHSPRRNNIFNSPSQKLTQTNHYTNATTNTEKKNIRKNLSFSFSLALALFLVVEPKRKESNNKGEKKTKRRERRRTKCEKKNEKKKQSWFNFFNYF